MPATGARVSAEHTTAVLLRRLRGGEAAARELLCARLEPQLRRWARGRLPANLRGSADTADLVQTALLRVLGKLEGFESAHAGALYGYVRTAMAHALCDALRAHPQAQRVDFETLAELPQLPDSPLEAALGREGVLAYEQALASLAPEYRELVLMRFEFGMSFPEIAAELGQSADGVRMKLNRALKQMALMLDDDEP